MCFSPQPRAIFVHRNFQNGSAPVVFSTFWLTNMLRATAACHFSPVCQNSYLRTRRFSEATFRTSATTNHWKNAAIRDFTNIFRACWTPCYWLCTPVDLLAPDSTHMLIFLLLTWLLLDSSLQLYILSEVRLLNFLRQSSLQKICKTIYSLDLKPFIIHHPWSISSTSSSIINFHDESFVNFIPGSLPGE